MTADFDKASFARVASVLAPYLGDLVFVGGWAHRLFELHPLAQATEFPPLMTLDADIAAPENLARRGGQDIRKLLLEKEFKEELSGDHRPPKAEYHLLGRNQPVFLEFLTPLTGGEHDRKHVAQTTTRIQGVIAQKLRYIDVLLTAPWMVELSASRGYPVTSSPLQVTICNPVSYIAQKVLTLEKRSSEKRAKDILYLHDTLRIFAGALPGLQALWHSEIRRTLPPKAARRVVEARVTLFGSISDDARTAAIQAESSGARVLPAERLVAACRLGLSTIFGD